jgi:hypothetical protein
MLGGESSGLGGRNGLHSLGQDIVHSPWAIPISLCGVRFMVDAIISGCQGRFDWLGLGRGEGDWMILRLELWEWLLEWFVAS